MELVVVMVVVVICCPLDPHIPIPCSIIPRQLPAPTIHPVSSGLQSWGWVLGVGPWHRACWLTTMVGGAHCPVVLLLSIIVLSLSIVILLSTLQAVACSSGIGVLSWHWLVIIAELEPKKKHKQTLIS